MLKIILAVLAGFYAAACLAAVDVNRASAAELDSIKGIGPAISSKILDERKKGNFKDWSDFISRVNGIGQGNAAKFSAEGLTVNASPFKAAASAKMSAPGRTPASSAQSTPAVKNAASASKK